MRPRNSSLCITREKKKKEKTTSKKPKQCRDVSVFIHLAQTQYCFHSFLDPQLSSTKILQLLVFQHISMWPQTVKAHCGCDTAGEELHKVFLVDNEDVIQKGQGSPKGPGEQLANISALTFKAATLYSPLQQIYNLQNQLLVKVVNEVEASGKEKSLKMKR